MQIMSKQIPLIALMLFLIGGTVMSYAAYSVFFKTVGTYSIVNNEEIIVSHTAADFGEFTGLGGYKDIAATIRTSSGTEGRYKVYYDCTNLAADLTFQVLVDGSVVDFIIVEPHAATPKDIVLRLIVPADKPSGSLPFDINWKGELTT